MRKIGAITYKDDIDDNDARTVFPASRCLGCPLMLLLVLVYQDIILIPLSLSSYLLCTPRIFGVAYIVLIIPYDQTSLKSPSRRTVVDIYE